MFDPLSPHGQGFGLVPKPPTTSGHICYLIPHDLLCRLEDDFEGEGFDPQKLVAEYEFTESMQDRGRWVGLRRWFGAQHDLPITYDYLPREMRSDRQRNEELGGFDLAGYGAVYPGADLVAMADKLKKGKARTKHWWEIAQAYAGWLMTNPEFIAEHDRLMADFQPEIETWGFPQHALPIRRGAESPDRPQLDERLNVYGKACDAFYLKWRLLALAGPGLPVPLQPGVPVPPTIHLLSLSPKNGKLFYFPDTFPIPSREELREQLEEALRCDGPRPAHMAEWTAMVGNSNTAKNKLFRYGRLFEIQHYCRLLKQRHPEALYGHMAKLKKSLASFLGCTEACVHADMMFLNKRLGRNWIERSCGLEAVVDPSKPPAVRKPR